MKINHAAILAGGFGRRLGNITKKIPKPLLKINKIEFIKYLIFNLIINGFKKIIILTYYKSRIFEKELNNLKFSNITIKCIKEKKPLGTGGSIAQLKRFKKDFLIINGDSYVNFDFEKFKKLKKENLAKILLVKNKNYKSNKKLSNLGIKNQKIFISQKESLMNSGIYIFRKKFLDNLKVKNDSLENTILPKYINKRLIEGYLTKNKFIDIGIKKNLKKASSLLKGEFKIKAILFDRDGTLNKNYGYVSKIENFKWLNGVKDALKFLKFLNIKIIVVTNQSGIGRGFYSAKDFENLNKKINIQLKKYNSKIDRFYYAPYFKYSEKKEYRKGLKFRKPNNGMIKKAMKELDLTNKNCFMIGDKKIDFDAAKKSKIKFYRKKNFSLFNQILVNIKNFNIK